MMNDQKMMNFLPLSFPLNPYHDVIALQLHSPLPKHSSSAATSSFLENIPALLLPATVLRY